jgi:hypothetical protein
MLDSKQWQKHAGILRWQPAAGFGKPEPSYTLEKPHTGILGYAKLTGQLRGTDTDCVVITFAVMCNIETQELYAVATASQDEQKEFLLHDTIIYLYHHAKLIYETTTNWKFPVRVEWEKSEGEMTSISLDRTPVTDSAGSNGASTDEKTGFYMHL